MPESTRKEFQDLLDFQPNTLYLVDKRGQLLLWEQLNTAGGEKFLGNLGIQLNKATDQEFSESFAFK